LKSPNSRGYASLAKGVGQRELVLLM
jgi:hypothetical protein